MLFRSLPKSEQRFLSQTCVLIFGQGSCNAGVSDTSRFCYIVCCDTCYGNNFIKVSIFLACKTTTGPDQNKPCVFPFTFSGVTYTECTKANFDHLWCSTKVDDNGNFIQNHWGNCDISLGACPPGNSF